MKKASEYRQHATECRSLANALDQGDQRDQLLEMAPPGNGSPTSGSELVRRHPELAMVGEHQEELDRTGTD